MKPRILIYFTFVFPFFSCMVNTLEKPLDNQMNMPSPYATRSDLSLSSDVYYHEGTGLVLQAYDLFANPQVHMVEERIDGVTHLGIKFFPKDVSQQSLLSNSDIAVVSYIPFGFSPVPPNRVVPDGDVSKLPHYPEKSRFIIDDRINLIASPTSNTEAPNTLQLPIMYALWPVDEPLPEGIEYDVCFKARIPQDADDSSTRSQGNIQYNAEFKSYDAFLNDYVPLNKLKVMISYDIYSDYYYTNGSGYVSMVPNMLGLPSEHYSDLEVVVILQSNDWIISQDNNTTPIHHYIGTTGNLWFLPYPTTFMSIRTSNTSEYEIHRTVDYYFNNSHPLSPGITSGEHGVIIHALSYDPGVDGITYADSSGYLFVGISNGIISQKEKIATTFHELGHVRMLNTVGFNSFNSTNLYVRESYASYVGWLLSNNYYTSLGYMIPYSGYQLTMQDRQNWLPTITSDLKYYTPFFIDIVDNYNQPAILDYIYGVPISAIENMMSSCSTITQCGVLLYNYAGLEFSPYEVTQYLTYYAGL